MREIDFSQLPSPIARYRDQLGTMTGDELPDHVMNWYGKIALAQAEARERERREIVDLAGWQREREALRAAYKRALGPFPEHVVVAEQRGEIVWQGTTIRNFLFEAMPGNWVAANIYLPAGAASGNRVPAIVVPCGHGIRGKIAYIERALQLVHNGYGVLTFDFVGTGERQLHQYQKVLYATSTQHNILGSKLPLTGHNLGWFMVQETMAAVTLLQQQPEVDPEAIGITGSSGGGWTTVHTTALDSRIKVAVPAASVCSFRYEVQADDAEQVMLGMQRRGIHYADLIAFLVCPRPMFVVANQHDIWSLNGTRYAVEEARRYYKMQEADAALAMEVWDKGHAYENDQLAVAIAWFNRWLRKSPATPTMRKLAEAELPPWRELLLTAEHNLFAAGYRRPNQIFNDHLAKLEPSAERDDEALMARIKEEVALHGYVPTWREIDRFVPEEGLGSRIIYSPDEGLQLPAEVLIPGQYNAITILIDATDRRYDLAWQMEHFSRGSIVVRPDLRGWGESANRESWSDWEGWTQNLHADRRYQLAATARLTGRNLVLDRARDLVALVTIMAGRFPDMPIKVWGRGQGALVALYAALVDERITELTLQHYLRSYRDLLQADTPLWTIEGNVDNILCGRLDIPELLARCRCKVRLLDPRDGALRPVTS